MARSLTAGMLQQITADTLRPFIAIEVDFADGVTTRGWTGYGEIEIDGETYLGLGTFINISTIEESTENKATGISLQLTGVPPEVVATALGEDYQGNPARVYIGALDSDTGVVINDPYNIFTGRVDTMNLTFDSQEARITVSVESRLIDFEKAPDRRFTPEDQKLDFPNDEGLEYVASIQDKQVSWGVGVEE